MKRVVEIVFTLLDSGLTLGNADRRAKNPRQVKKPTKFISLLFLIE